MSLSEQLCAILDSKLFHLNEGTRGREKRLGMELEGAMVPMVAELLLQPLEVASHDWTRSLDEFCMRDGGRMGNQLIRSISAGQDGCCLIENEPKESMHVQHMF